MIGRQIGSVVRASRSSDGPSLLSGVSGSGKTCVAVKRAIRLAEANKQSQVLLITLNRSLAGLIRLLVDQAAIGLEERMRIKVISFFELCQEHDDLYAPVAAQLGVGRPTAKVAVLGAMYGQTTGHGAQALRRLNAAYPVAMAYLDGADRSGRAGRDLRTYGGRLIVLTPSEPRSTSRAAAYGRYARNAMIQGAAAELFKVWAVTVRARCGHLGARIVLCLHDELLVHCPREQAETVSRLVDDCLREATQRWAPGCGVRFISDTTIVRSWSDAKNGRPGT